MSFEVLEKEDRIEPSIVQQAANRMKMSARQTYRQLTSTFNEGAKRFWKNPRVTPQEILDELGTDAGDVFKLHGLLGQLLAQVKPEDIAEGLAVVGEFTYEEDGRVTLVNSPA